MSIVAWVVPAILILVLVSAFFSASETALLVLNRIRLHHMVTRGIKNSKIIYKLVSDPDSLIATILIGNNFVNVALSVLITILFIYFFGNTFLVALVATLIASIIVLFLGEIVPKTFSLRSPERVSIGVSPFVRIFVIIFTPIAKFFTRASNAMLSLFGIRPRQHIPLVTEEEVRLMIEAGKKEGLFGEEQRKMLHRIFEFGTTLVRDVMVPRDKIIGVDINASDAELLDVMTEEGHSRLIVYKNDIDNIVGIIYVRDVLHVLKNAQLVKVPDLVSTAYFVAPDKRVNELLKDFQKTDVQLAIVQGANGMTLGIVTMEDLLEEIVGEI